MVEEVRRKSGLNRTLSAVAAQRCGEAGIRVDEEDIFSILTRLTSIETIEDYPRGADGIIKDMGAGGRLEAGQEQKASQKTQLFVSGSWKDEFFPGKKHWTEGRTEGTVLKDEGELTLQQGCWRVSIFFHTDMTCGWVCTSVKGDLGTWVKQDLPSGVAAEVFFATDWGGKDGRGVDEPFLGKETHYTQGLLWDPDRNTAAETCYYEDGGIRWIRRSRGGKFASRDGKPCLESFGRDGNPELAEYGSEGVGRHRPVEEGPAYIEFHPNGQAAVEIFVERGKVKKSNWFDLSGNKIEPVISHSEIADRFNTKRLTEITNDEQSVCCWPEIGAASKIGLGSSRAQGLSQSGLRKGEENSGPAAKTTFPLPRPKTIV